MNSASDQDVIIVGGAAAGLTAAMYTARRTLKTLVLSKDIGGQAALTTEIENYPGRELVDGVSLMQDFRKQAECFGAEIRLAEALKIDVQNRTSFQVQTHHETLTCRALILAFGLTPRNLDVPGEEALIGRGVSTCATCDAPLYRGKKVAVVGVGDTAIDAVILLSRIAKEVMYICPRPDIRASKPLLETLATLSNVTTYLDSVIKEIHGETRVADIVVEKNFQEKEKISVDGVFVEMGYRTKVDWVKDLVQLDDNHHIVIDQNHMTSVPGIFAAGDITQNSHKQVVISAGDGAKAALCVYQYLQKEGVIARGSVIDWGRVEKSSKK